MKQHYLPECYLREFCNWEGKLHTLDLNLRKHRREVFDEPRHPAAVCRSKHFYTITPDMASADPALSKVDELFLERSFGEYENRYPALITKLKRGQAYLQSDDVELLLYFILSFKLRNPVYRALFSDNKEKIVEEMIAKARGIVDGWPDGDFQVYGQSREEFLAVIDQKESEMLQDKMYAEKAHRASLIKKSRKDDDFHQKFRQHLMQFQWVLFRSKDQFITSDNPGFAMDRNNRILNTKFSDDFFYFLPLTPSLCFSVSPAGLDKKASTGDGKKHFTIYDAEPSLIRTINTHHREHLSQYIFASSRVMIDAMAALINAGSSLV